MRPAQERPLPPADSRPVRELAAAWLAAAALLLVGLPARAQEPPAPPPAPPAFVPVAEVAPALEELDQELRKLSRQLVPEAPVVEIAGRLPERHAGVKQSALEMARVLAGAPSRSAIEDLEFAWRSHEAILSGWSAALTQRAADLEGKLAALEALEARWRATLENAQQTGAPLAVADRVRGALRSLDKTVRAARERRSVLLTLQSEVAKEQSVVSDGLEELSAARHLARQQLLEADAPPLWVALAEAREGEPLAGRFRVAQERDLALARTFVDQQGTRLGLAALLFAGALAVALALSRRVATWSEEDPDLGKTALVFERPVSAALLVTLLTAPLVFPTAPVVVRNAIGVMLLVPLFRLVPPLMHEVFRPAIYGLAVFYLVDRARDVLEPVPLIERLVFAGQTAAAAAAVAWLLRPRRLASLAGASVPRALGLAARLALALLVAATAANLLGYVAFARVLGEGVLGSAYAGVVLYGGLRVLRAGLRVVVHTRRLQSLRVVARRRAEVHRWLAQALSVAAFAAWLLVTLELFGVDEPVLEALRVAIGTPLRLGTVSLSLGDVLAFLVTLASAVALSRLLRSVLEDDVFPRVTLRRGIANATSTLIHYAVLLLGFVLAVGAAGVDFGRFTLLAGAFGVGLGFGLQNVVNNFVSGMILLFERPVQVGDIIEVGGQQGEVRRIGIRSSTLRTFEGAEVIVPNGNLISEQVVNWTLSDRLRRIDLPVGVAYGTDPERVLGLLLEVARSNSEVLDYPEPVALFRGFGESSLDFELRAWSGNFLSYVRTQSDLAVAVSRALAEAGIAIPFPQRDLHLKTVERPAARELRGGGEG